MIKESIGSKIFDFLNIIFMLVIMFITIYPMLYIVFASTSTHSQLASHRGFLFAPLGFTTRAYEMVFKNSMIGYGYLNTIFIVIVGVIINIIMTSLGAYFLSRKGVLWSKYIMFMIVFTMFFNGGLIPFYFTVRGVGLENSLWALILPVSINTFNLIIMRTSFKAIPDSMEESAKLDGANDFTVLFRIILPLSLPVVAVMILYYAVSHWNSWFNAMIFLRDRRLYPLPLILREILISNNTNLMMSNTSYGDQESVSDIDNIYDSKADAETIKQLYNTVLYERPDGKRIIADLKKKQPNFDHPRIFATKDTFDKIRRNMASDPETARYAKAVIATADTALKQELTPYAIPDGTRMSSPGAMRAKTEP